MLYQHTLQELITYFVLCKKASAEFKVANPSTDRDRLSEASEELLGIVSDKSSVLDGCATDVW